MLLYIVIALLIVCLLMGLQRGLFERAYWKDQADMIKDKHKRWDKDHYWDDKANTWRRKDGGPVNYYSDD